MPPTRSSKNRYIHACDTNTLAGPNMSGCRLAYEHFCCSVDFLIMRSRTWLVVNSCSSDLCWAQKDWRNCHEIPSVGNDALEPVSKQCERWYRAHTMLYCKCTDIQQVFTVHLMHYEVARGESRSKRFKEQLQRPSMHRDSKNSSDYALLRRSNSNNRGCIATASAGKSLNRYCGAAAATEHASRRREQRRLCIATAERRQ